MPLEKSPSKAAVGRNIKEMQDSGYPHKQAVAASLNNQRKSKFSSKDVATIKDRVKKGL